MEPNEIIRLLDELGKRLTPAGEYVFELAVKQQMIEAIPLIFIEIVLALVTISLVVNGFLYWKKNNRRSGWSFVGVFEFASVPLVAFFIILGPVLTKLFNPEYAALQSILKQIK